MEDVVQGDIRFNERDHSYIHVPTKKKLTPVSKVIDTIYATKSYDPNDPIVAERVEAARIRGSAVDRYMAEYIHSSSITIAPGESADIAFRVVAAHKVWEEEFGGMKAEAQKIVYSLEDGVAGTLDFWVNDSIVVDLKCTYRPEKRWILQLGAYCTYVQGTSRCGIIHVTKDGGTWMEYDMYACMRYWAEAVQWWKHSNGMEAAKRRQ